MTEADMRIELRLVNQDINTLIDHAIEIKNKLMSKSYLVSSTNTDFELMFRVCKRFLDTLARLKGYVPKGQIDFVHGMEEKVTQLKTLTNNWKSENDEEKRRFMLTNILNIIKVHLEELIGYGIFVNNQKQLLARIEVLSVIN